MIHSNDVSLSFASITLSCFLHVEVFVSVKPLIGSVCLMMTWQVALSQVDGTKSRDHFMRALFADIDANTDEVTDETLEV